jgi:predicted SprT family Zn-dependent metalloprotease
MEITFAQLNDLFKSISAEMKQKYPCLQNWSIKWNTRLGTSMGRAIRKSNGTKIIELSSVIAKLNLDTPNFLERMRQTILHEWAHALDWETSKGWDHGKGWKNWMGILGIPAERCFSDAEWLVKPKSCSWAIRHKSAGKVFCYSKFRPDQQMIYRACSWAVKNKLQINELELISLESAR